MKAYLLLLILLTSLSLKAVNPRDSVVFKIDKRNQTLIGSKQNSGNALRQDLSLVFEKKGLVLTDSLWQNIRKMLKSDSDLDSSIYIKIGNSQVKIDVIRSDKGIKRQQESTMGPKPLDSVITLGTNQKEKIDTGMEEIHSKETNGEKLQIDKNGVRVKETNGEKLQIDKNGVRVKETNGKEIEVGWNGVRVKKSNGEETRIQWSTDSLKTKQKREKENFFNRDGMNVYLGLNGLSGEVPSITTMIYPPNFLQTDLNLKPLSSRYISVEFSASLNLVKNNKSAFRLGYGISFDWYNFMFDHNRRVQNTNFGAIFQPMFDSQGKDLVLSKNKLTVSYINIPVMPHVVFNKNSSLQMIGLGGYVGYRIDSWTKSIEEKTENLNRVSSNFNLNPFRYGLRAEFALRKLPDLFFNYDLSPLFEKNSSPNLAGFSFGIRIL